MPFNYDKIRKGEYILLTIDIESCKKSIAAVMLGVLIAGIIMLLISVGVFNILV